jgi:hypothetical protein
MITDLPKLALSFSLLVLTSGSRAPSFTILGSFFPAWPMPGGVLAPHGCNPSRRFARPF